MKTKIIAVIVVIAVIMSILCVGTFAIDIENTIPIGTILIFKENPLITSNRYYSTFLFTNENESYNRMDAIIVDTVGTIKFLNGTETVIAYSNGHWNTSRQIVLNYDYEIPASQTDFENLFETVIYPTEIPNILENVNGILNTTLTVATLIITWLVANQIALCGLYLYIMIAVIGICKRFVNAK